MDADFPKGVIIAAVIRWGKVIVPRGETVFLDNDTVVIFSFTEHIATIKKMFA